ncbi:hypothetical protein K438DRAFT_1558795 [Mycena galopus ATCC 62051]|nr:hypothetical protein K438DRAFT_1558795 [Mycena galopus ATCC 62051]
MGVLEQLRFLAFSFLPDQFFSKLPATHVDLTARTFVVTGSNTGLGLATAIHLARMNPAHLILAVRDPKKGNAAKDEIVAETGFAGLLEVWELDMADFASVKRFVERVNTLERLDGAVLNAGINVPSWDKLIPLKSSSFQVNMLATGLLGVLLLPILKKTAQFPLPHPDAPKMSPHLTITGSGAQFLAEFPEKTAPEILKALNDESKNTKKRDRYPTSKLLLILYARAMAELPSAEGVIVNIADPGLCISSIGAEYNLGSFLVRRVAWTTTKGALNLVYAALKPMPSGAYISSCEIRQCVTTAWSRSEDGMRVQKKVWGEMVEVWSAASPDVESIVKRA